MALPGYMRWLPDAALKKLGRIEFLAHGTVDGFIAGRHKSARKGASAEFAEHRAYVAGDDLRNLDWKLVARRQRLYVKQYVDETNLRATVVLDASGSMAYRGRSAVDRLSKLEYGQYIAASLAYLLVNQQDAVGFVSYDTEIRDLVPAKAEPSQVRCILERLDALKPGGETDMAGVLHEVAERIPRRSVVFLVSDFFSDGQSLLKALHHLRFRHHEVIAIQVCDHDELTFPFERISRFEDLETRQSFDVDARALRDDYLARLNAHFAELARGCGEMRRGLSTRRCPTSWCAIAARREVEDDVVLLPLDAPWACRGRGPDHPAPSEKAHRRAHTVGRVDVSRRLAALQAAQADARGHSASRAQDADACLRGPGVCPSVSPGTALFRRRGDGWTRTWCLS